MVCSLELLIISVEGFFRIQVLVRGKMPSFSTVVRRYLLFE